MNAKLVNESLNEFVGEHPWNDKIRENAQAIVDILYSLEEEDFEIYTEWTEDINVVPDITLPEEIYEDVLFSITPHYLPEEGIVAPDLSQEFAEELEAAGLDPSEILPEIERFYERYLEELQKIF